MVPSPNDDGAQDSNAESLGLRRSKRSTHPSIKMKEIQKDHEPERVGEGNLPSPITPSTSRHHQKLGESVPAPTLNTAETAGRKRSAPALPFEDTEMADHKMCAPALPVDSPAMADRKKTPSIDSEYMFGEPLHGHSHLPSPTGLSNILRQGRNEERPLLRDYRTLGGSTADKTSKTGSAPKSRKKNASSRSKQFEQSAKNQPEQQPAPITGQSYDLPSFSMDTFIIYNWQAPQPRLPKDFFTMDAGRRAWKARIDQFEGTDILKLDGSDDWDAFAGNPQRYASLYSFYRVIGRTFVNRAKRAFRAGKSWDEFAQSEYVEDSSKHALAAEDPAMRPRLLEEALDNDIRIAVFEKLAPRLCNEIWLLPHGGPPASRQKRDSKVAEMDDEQPHVEDWSNVNDTLGQAQPQNRNKMPRLGASTERAGLASSTAGGMTQADIDRLYPPLEISSSDED